MDHGRKIRMEASTPLGDHAKINGSITFKTPFD